MLKEKIKLKLLPGQRLFFTSDTHFGHANIIKYCSRPYNDIQEMDEDLIQRWNNTVTPNDIVFHLGDFAFNVGDNIMTIIRRLNGHIYIVPGNHDNTIWVAIAKENPDKVTLCESIQLISVNHKEILLCHYPLLCYAGSYRGTDAAIQLFGHVHSGPNSVTGLDCQRLMYLQPTQYDVGVDNNNYTPISLEELLEKINDQMMSQGLKNYSYYGNTTDNKQTTNE